MMLVLFFISCIATFVIFLTTIPNKYSYVSIGLIVLSLLVGNYTEYFKVKHEVRSWDVPLIALNDNFYVSGSMHLAFGSGTGGLEQVFKYDMYTKTKTGAKLVSLPLEDVTIVFSEKKVVRTSALYRINPKGIWKYLHLQNPLMDDYIDGGVHYTLMIPPNSISNKLNLDAK